MTDKEAVREVQVLRQKIESNERGHDYVVGDVHGYYHDLIHLLTKANFDPTVDRLFSVGDLIDRGPNSEQCLSLLNETWFYAVMGNHEQMMLSAYDDPENGLNEWLWTGADVWIRDIDPNQMSQYAEKVSKLPLVMTVGDGDTRFNVFHAEFLSSDRVLDAGHYSFETQNQLLWGRELATDPSKAFQQVGLSTSFCGHTPMRQVTRIGSQVFVDTGASYSTRGGKLTVVRVSDMQLYQRDENDAPYQPSKSRKHKRRMK